MAPAEKRLGPTTYDLQPLEDALSALGLEGIYTRAFLRQLSEDTAKLRSGTLSLAEVKDDKTAPAWLRNTLTGKVNAPNPGLRAYTGHWYNSYLRIAANGYGRGPDLLVEARHADGDIGPPDYAFDLSRTCAPVQLTSYAPHQDDQLVKKQESWSASSDMFRASKTRTLLQLQITSHLLQSGAPRIDKIVCMGLGSLTRQTGSSDAWFRPYFQHIVALCIAQALDDLYSQHIGRYGQADSQVRVLAQDPSYSDSDKRVLSDNGINVVEDPNGLLAIDKTTFVMSAFPSFPLYEIIADVLPGGPPAIFDASLPTEFHVDTRMQYNEFAAPRVKKMLQGRLIHKLKWDEVELNRMNQNLPMAAHWLPRMNLFLEPNNGAREFTGDIAEDVQRREGLINDMLPSGVRLLRQRIQQVFTATAA